MDAANYRFAVLFKGKQMSDTKNLVQQQYGAHASAYVTSAVHAQGASLKRLVELIQPQQDWRALDVSTGGGHTALAFAPFVREMIASDLTPEMLAAAEKFIRAQGVTNVEFKVGTFTTFHFLLLESLRVIWCSLYASDDCYFTGVSV